MDLGLSDRTVVVTGGASNLGHGIALAYAREGARVVVADIDEAQAERTTELVRDLGTDAIAVRTDVTDPEQCAAAVNRACEVFGGVDVLVNNAGVGAGTYGYFRDYTVEAAQRVMDLNYWGTFHFCRAVIEPMTAAGGGAIVNIGSSVYERGRADLPVYSSAKAAVVALSRCLALELGPSGIRVNVVAPGFVLPSGVEQIGRSSTKNTATAFNDYRALATGLAPGGGLLNPEDIAGLVTFLGSHRVARGITGKVLVATGGTVFGDEDERLQTTLEALFPSMSESRTEP
ncbi:3-oxoacyl-ACP reductase FabG [Pseudonocardia ailaonensis]|uniref:3-oxoacyl-ACP reductase FabG n=1 Tax=Pseudonocardia ailaonensis TaxID=367279 RepID=A0ABN2N6L3_9PSEU